MKARNHWRATSRDPLGCEPRGRDARLCAQRPLSPIREPVSEHARTDLAADLGMVDEA